MDGRQALIALLEAHQPEDEKERRDREVMFGHARTLADPFGRVQMPAHFTASALVVDDGGSRVCLVHHKKLERWLQPGGHIETGEHVAQAALREAREETALAVALHPRWLEPLDLDVHAIPARGDLPGHDHLDVRYLVLAAAGTARHDPQESLALRWFSWNEALALAPDPGLARLFFKARRLLSA
jgi:8-oxo-dGTP pyrophosphatase MutT (NUDIX family)